MKEKQLSACCGAEVGHWPSGYVCQSCQKDCDTIRAEDAPPLNKRLYTSGDGKGFRASLPMNQPEPQDWESGQTKGTPKQRAYWNRLRGVKNSKAPNWRGDKIGKAAVHNWLDANYGQPKICDMGELCKGKATWYDWALKTGYPYKRRRTYFLRLCRSCHRKYDLTPAKKLQAIENLWWKRGIKNPGKVNLQNLKSYKHYAN